MKQIELTDEIRDDEPAAYLVFCYDDILCEYKVFCYKVEAELFAEEQMEKADEQEWRIFPLWASHPKII